jgi:hypothetical protein
MLLQSYSKGDVPINIFSDKPIHLRHLTKNKTFDQDTCTEIVNSHLIVM